MNVNYLPSTSGVYLFKKGNNILYIGKSVNIKARVLSHFENAKIDRKESLIIECSDSIDYIVTDSEFKALLLEAKMIQKHHPKYNVIWRDDKSHLYIKITVKETYPKVLIVRKENDGRSTYFGPFSSVRTTSRLLKEIRRIVPFCTQQRISDRPCFYSKIGLCNPCPNEIDQRYKILDLSERRKLKKKYRKNINSVIRILNGNVKGVLNELSRKLKRLANQNDYEEAIRIRNNIFRFEELLYNRSLPDDAPSEYNESSKNLSSLIELLSVYFPRLTSLARIECYDVSNLSLKDSTASMVVLADGLIQRSEYKRFKIRGKKHISDFEMLREVFMRRFRNNWRLPNLIVVDGGKPQVRTVIKTLSQIRKHIPIIGIAKNPDRIVIGKDNFPTIRFISENKAFTLIRLIRDESHRFARKYHLFLRDRNFLS